MELEFLKSNTVAVKTLEKRAYTVDANYTCQYSQHLRLLMHRFIAGIDNVVSPSCPYIAARSHILPNTLTVNPLMDLSLSVALS